MAWRRPSVVVLLSAVLATALADPESRQREPAPQDPTCAEPLPPGFVSDFSWQGPWVYATSARTISPRLRIDSVTPQQERNGPIPIQLDDGSTGALNVENLPYVASRDGSPRDDCGCFEDDSYWIHVRSARGESVGDVHLWAAYGLFQVVPIDLVDGPGDELVVFRVRAHAAPSTGYDMTVWKIAGQAAIAMGRFYPVANCLGTVPVCCARGRQRAYLDLDSAKPRSIVLRTEIGALPCCRIVQDGDPREGLLPFGRPGSESVLTFDRQLRQYRR